MNEEKNVSVEFLKNYITHSLGLLDTACRNLIEISEDLIKCGGIFYDGSEKVCISDIAELCDFVLYAIEPFSSEQEESNEKCNS